MDVSRDNVMEGTAVQRSLILKLNKRVQDPRIETALIFTTKLNF
jgi:hypothetical protein